MASAIWLPDNMTGYTIILANDLIGANMGGRFNNLNLTQTGERVNSEYGTMRFCEVKPWKTDQTNSGTHNRLSDEDDDGYNLNRVRQIEGGTDWQNGQIGSEVIKWAEDANHNINIRTNEYDPNDPNAVPKEYTLHRTATQIGVDANNKPIYDMDNNLYFRLVKDYTFYGLTIKEFRIEFSAEGTFKADVVPSAAGPATSAIGAPFETSKIDIGEMKERTKTSNGQSYTHYAFEADSIKNLVAYNWLYQDDAYEDGIPADVAGNKNIRPVEVDGQLLYALKSDTYFIETPIEITNKSGNTAPIGYRIVGALFTPLWGEESSVTIPGGTYHYIAYTSGEKTYYLNSDGRFVETDEPTVWVSDYNGIHYGDRYLTFNGNYTGGSLSIGTNNSSQKLELDNSNRLYYDYYSFRTFYLHGTANASEAPSMTTNTSNLAVWETKVVEDKTETFFSPGPYKLKVWKRDGSGYMRWASDETGHILSTNDETADDYIEISGGTDTNLGKIIDMGLCNNDAIKFEIEVEDGKQALVQVTLLLQALDPYIDKMDIVCHDEPNILQLTQSFTSDDFSVSGGKFIFYVPYDYKDEMLTFTFADLYSKYGDETYYGGGSGTGRYSYVTSEYFLNRIDGNGNDGLYQTGVYDPNHPYNGYPVTENGIERRSLSKIETSTAGNIRFKFNNAEDLKVGGSEQDGYLEEYPFSVANYLASTDPGDPLSATPHGPDVNVSGSFGIVQLQASSANQHSGTYFVFTADETRWNIAPSTKWQHRYYAFYRMEIDLQAKTFTPDFTWTKIYDKTCYAGKDEDGKEIDAEDSMWGLTLDVSDTENGQKVQGYLTYQEIIDNIQGREKTYWQQGDKLPDGVNVGDVKWEAITGCLDPNNETAPASMEQILYVDGTPLYAMLNSSQYSDVKTLNDLQEVLCKNTIVFLPENTTSTNNNVAFETTGDSETRSFRAGKDIVLTDKIPFFTPYDIQVDAANFASYKREVSGPGNTLVDYATLVLPFTLRVDADGKHTNDTNDGYAFNIRKMVGLASPTDAQTGNNNYYAEGNFMLLKDVYEDAVSQTEANIPYMIEVTAAPEGNSTYSFVASQKGSTIYATPYDKDANGMITGHKNFEGETVSNAKDGGSLTNYGTYSGVTIHAKKEVNGSIEDDNIVYYFNKNKYVSSVTLNGNKFKDVFIRPFRSYYLPSTSSPSKMIGFNIVYDQFYFDEGIATSIDKTSLPKVMTITTDKRSMLINAIENVQVKIMSANGANMGSFFMNAGEQKQMSLPSGVYIVNKTKVIVK